MKKLLVLLLAALLIILPVIAVSAASTADVTVSSVTAQKGDTVTFTISVSNCTEAKSIYIVPEYDDQVLDIVSGTWLMTGALTDNWSAAFGDAAIAFADNQNINTDIFELVFKVKDNARVGSVADVSCEIVIKTMNGQQEVDVDFSLTGGSVTVVCPHTNTQSVSETPAKCNESGYTAGVFCNDCETYISGHTEIPATGNHVDADGKWESDGTSHWHTCACTKEFDKATCSGGNATCQAKAICSVCGNAWGTVGGHDYDISVWGYKTSEGHAHMCKNCTEHDTVVSHTPDRAAATCDNDKACSACGFVLESAIGHDYTEQVKDEAHPKDKADKCTEYNTYWYDCSRCDANAKNDAKATDKFYTDTVAGPHVYTEKLADDAHFVAGSGTNCQNAKKYYYDCAYCNTMGTEIWVSTEFGTHEFDTTQWGYKAKEKGHAHKCKFCDAHDTIQPHDPDLEANEEVDQICTECKIVLVPGAGHFCVYHLTSVSAKPNSCTEPGNKAYYTCSCGKYYEDPLATKEITDKDSVNLTALGHDYSEKSEDAAHLKHTAANCREKTAYWYDCSRCDANAKDDAKAADKFYETTAGAHDFSEKIEDADHVVLGTGVNCQSKFSYYYDCKYCTQKSSDSYWTSEKVGEHNISSTWTTLDGVHSRECGVEGCAHAEDKATCSGGKATCQAKAVCSTCTNEYGALADHVYGTDWEYKGKDGHSLVCQTAGCGDLKKVEAHTPDFLDEKCLNCGYIFHTCGGKEATYVPTVPATCTVSGMKAYYKCSCGKCYADVNATLEITDLDSLEIPAGHEIVKEYGYSATCTEKGLTDGEYCRVCKTVFKSQTVIPANGHSWSAWVTVDVLDDGAKVMRRSCSCGNSEEKSIASEHEHAIIETEAKAPTCTETGLTAGAECSECGETITAQDTVPALGHTASEAVKENVVEATEAAEGSYDLVVYCSVCFAEISHETIKVPALEHKHVIEDIAAVAPTCTESGLTAGTKCSTCSEIITAQETVPALGHTTSRDVKENVVEATEAAEGSYDLVVYCSVCSAEISRETVKVPALDAESTAPEACEPETTESSGSPTTGDNAIFLVAVVLAVAALSVAIAKFHKRED